MRARLVVLFTFMGITAWPVFPAQAVNLPVQFDWSAALWNSFSGSKVLDSPFNPSNAAGLPSLKYHSDIRPDLKLSWTSLKSVVRPRFQYEGSQTTTTTHNFNIYFSDAFGVWTASDALTFTYGLQNYQWGPAESAGPSNQFFHETAQQRDLLFAVNGKHLFRVNYSPTENLNFVGLAELTGNVDSAFVAEQGFLPKFALKSEWSWSGGADFVGFVIGGTSEKGWIGQYANLSLSDALSAYVDASEEIGSNVWYPNGLTLDKSKASNGVIYPFVVAGLRYSFESGSDLRAEYILSTGSYSDAERTTLTQTLQVPSLTNASRSAAPGFEIPGKYTLYLSFRRPDLLKLKDLTFFIRYLFSVSDYSGQAFVSLDYALSDHGTLLGSALLGHGRSDTELRGLTEYTLAIAYRHAW